MSDYVIMPRADYKNICDAIREKTGKADSLTSVEVAWEISAIPTGGGGDGSSFASFISGTSETVEIPYGATAVRNYAFFKDGVVSTILLPETIASIGVEAFRECSNLSSIEIPASVTTISYRAFWYDSGLTTVVFKGTPSRIQNDAFLSTGVTDIYVPWSEQEVAGAPWGAVNATIHYEAEV